MLPVTVQLLVDCGDGLPAVELPVQQGTRVAELKAMLLSSSLGLALGERFELLAHNPGSVSFTMAVRDVQPCMYPFMSCVLHYHA